METLTPEQAAQIAIIVEKWRAIALSTEPINRHKAASAIRSAYALIGKEVPEIVFCSSPYDAWNKIFLSHLDLLVEQIEEQIVTNLVDNPGIINTLNKQQRMLVVGYLYQIPSRTFNIEPDLSEPIEISFYFDMLEYFYSRLGSLL